MTLVIASAVGQTKEETKRAEMRGPSGAAVFILQLEILGEEHLGRKWGSVFPGLKADQCGLTTVSD